jgi:hypothetical protein
MSSQRGKSNTSQQIIQKLWNYCSVLRDDGLSYRAAREDAAQGERAAMVIPDNVLFEDGAGRRAGPRGPKTRTPMAGGGTTPMSNCSNATR